MRIDLYGSTEAKLEDVMEHLAIRYSLEDLLPEELLDALPPAAAYAGAVFPTLEEQEASKETIVGQWDTIVGANLQEAP